MKHRGHQFPDINYEKVVLWLILSLYIWQHRCNQQIPWAVQTNKTHKAHLIDSLNG